MDATPKTIVKVTFFVTSSSNASSQPQQQRGSDNKKKPTPAPGAASNRTQVWLSLAMMPTTCPRDCIIAAFRHAIERLGGAKLDAHPTKTMVFLQSHGEFIRLEQIHKPLLEYEPVAELVHNEKKQFITLALISEEEFFKYNGTVTEGGGPRDNGASPASPTPREGPAAGGGDVSEEDNGSFRGGNGSGSQFQFRGRNRQGSILPKALAHDPLADQRLRPVAQSSAANSHSLDGSFNGNDSFSDAHQLSPGSRHGAATIDYFTPLGKCLSTKVEYPIGTMCRDVVVKAIEQLAALIKESSASPSELQSTLSALSLGEKCLALLYKKDDGSVRRFRPDEVLPVSRGLRPDGVHLYLSLDAQAAEQLDITKRTNETVGRVRRGSVAGLAARRGSIMGRPTDFVLPPGVRIENGEIAEEDRERVLALLAANTLRISGSAATLKGYGIATCGSSEKRSMLPGDIGAALSQRLQRFGVVTSAANDAQKATQLSTSGGSTNELVGRLLTEETDARIDLAAQQVHVARLRNEIRDAEEALRHNEKLKAEQREQLLALQQTIGEGQSAVRDCSRLEELLRWFETTIEASRERQRSATRQLFEMDRPPV